MHILVVNNHTLHLHTIHTLFSPSDQLTYIAYRQLGWYDLRPFDCIVLTWSSSHAYTNKTFGNEIHIIAECNKPIIGLCLGCELIAEAFGGIIAKHEERIAWDLAIMCEWDMHPHIVHEAHKYSLIWLGDALEWLARSQYWYEIVKHKTKPIIWFQFHPEVAAPSNDGYNLYLKYRPALWLWKTTLS